CEEDVDDLARLLGAMLPYLDLPRATLRGRYMAACAWMEWAGVPIDTDTLARLRDRWDTIRGRLIAAGDARDGRFDGLVFKEERWAAYLDRKGIPWPRLASGRLALDDDGTFKQMAKLCPDEVGPIRELRYALSQLKLNKLAVGPDG